MHIFVGRLRCGCCGRSLRHNTSGHPYYWCPGLNIYHLDGCVKRIEDFYLEEVILYELQQHIMELEDSDRQRQKEKESAIQAAEELKKKCRAAGNALEKAKKKRMEEFEAYALGKKEKYEASAGEMEALRKKYEELAVLLSEAEEKARAYGRMKDHKAFAVRKLTPELLDEYVESIEVRPEDEVRIRWK